jgi:hypothetical protein
MRRSEGATPCVGDVISYREPGPSGPVTRRGKVVGVNHDSTTDEAVPVVKGGAGGQTQPAASWDRILRGAPGPGPAPRRRPVEGDAAAELNRRLGRQPGPGGPQ